MPSLGSGLSLGTISRLPGFDFDASVYINANSIPETQTIPSYGLNSIKYSNNFLQSTGLWNNSLINITANYAQNPFFTATDATLIANKNTSFGRILRISSLADAIRTSTRYNLSVFAKAGASSFLGMRIASGLTNSDVYPHFNLSNGTAISITPNAGTLHNMTITSFGNGWYRCSVSYTTPSTISSDILDFAVTTSTGSCVEATTENSNSVLIWGAQLEISNSNAPSDYAEVSGGYAQYRTSGSLINLTIEPRKQINNFVKELKNLGLWSNSVFWPLRSFQNNQVGTGVSSLGGLGSYAGTLTGGPTRRLSGVLLSSNQRIAVSVPYGATSGSLIGVTSTNSLSKEYGLLRDATNNGIWNPYSDNSYYFDYANPVRIISTPAPHVVPDNFNFISGYAGSSGLVLYRNSTLLTSGGTSANSSGSATDIAKSFTNAIQDVAFVMLSHSDARNSHSSIYSIYKSTLGQGLYLP